MSPFDMRKGEKLINNIIKEQMNLGYIDNEGRSTIPADMYRVPEMVMDKIFNLSDEEFDKIVND